jgi:hypothetical protein
MAIVCINLDFDNMNVSAQVDDIVYYSYGGQSIGGFDQAQLPNTRRLGRIAAINGNQITVCYDDQLTTPPPIGSYISFAKDKRINTSSLLGYYMSINFVNNSSEKIELFSIGSEVSESSK